MNTENNKRSKRRIGLSILSLAVAVSTLSALLLPAFTLEKTAYCGVEEHRHSESCYEEVLVCPLEEGKGHNHNDSCYVTEQRYICGLEESTGHFHGVDCYETRPVLICPLEESEEHRHDESCWGEEQVLTCPLQESTGHVHDESCTEQVERIICGQQESPAHTHSPACYERQLICGYEEHEHSLACYSNPGAEENELIWTSAFPKLEGLEPKERVLTIAVSQLGYRESGENYCVLDDGRVQGYTRYGDWYGDPYGDWCAMFVSFCLHYAGISEDEMPRSQDCTLWLEALLERGQYVTAAEGAPSPGDLIFFDFTSDGLSDHVSLVARVNAEAGTLDVIGGDYADAVEQRSYQISDNTILGYGLLPEELSSAEAASSSEESETIEAPIAELTYPAQSFRAETEELTVLVEADAGVFPANTAMSVRLVPEEQVLDAVNGAVQGEVVWVQAVDISFFNEAGEEIQPLLPIRVSITSDRIAESETEDTEVVHVDADGAAQLVEQSADAAENADNKVAFEADSFSIYAVVGTVIEKRVLTRDGQSYVITVTFGDDAGVPEDASLEVNEIDPGNDAAAYADYAARTADALGCAEQNASGLRLFDIRIVDAAGEKVTIAAPVDVKIRLEGRETGEDSVTKLVHFADGAEQGDVIEQVEVAAADSEGSALTLSFAAEGFSVYAIVDAPEPAAIELKTVQNLAELLSSVSEGFCLSIKSPPQYFLSSLNDGSCFKLIINSPQEAAVWYFEPTPEDPDAYYIYTLIGGVKQYVVNPSGNFTGLSPVPSNAFVVTDRGNGTFNLQLKGYNKWLQYSNGGGGIRFWTDANNRQNCDITLTYADSVSIEKDPYKLDGKTFGIAYQNSGVLAAALTAESKTVGGKQGLAGKDMVMKPDVLDNDGVLLVAENSDIQEWTFESIREDQYYITTTVGGQNKYLNLNAGELTLSDEPGDASVIRAVPGTGANEGKWHFTVNGQSLNLSGSAANGFNASPGNGATTWMNLVKRSELDEEDFTLYSAKKVSVSDEQNVYNGQEVVIYTRIWNDTKKRYEFFAVDHNGTLIPCYDTGNNIEWIGSNVNTALWKFTEYRNADGTLSYFYELQNTQYGEYIAPQLTGNQSLSDQTIGINLNGRRNGENYSPIIAWDDDQYAYTGLKTENGRVVPCPLAEAEDFFFAVVNPIDEDDKLSTIATVDNNDYGITMRMIDYNNEKEGPNTSQRDRVQSEVLGKDSDGAGLLSTDLKDNGYPLARNGNSLEILYTATATQPMTTANHLFLQSVYNESGYFEYDSTQNFAHLNENGSFTVYDQLGSIGDYDRPTGNHGQFMPYDDLTRGKYCTFTNQYDVLAKELPYSNPRKGEKLYNIGTRTEVDYHFGMEMSASFTQTTDGLDAWGHDIIFEFSGDDDFWLYVDGELVLDLGGVHSAMTGSVNFRTGEIRTSTRGNSTLYETFRQHYEARGMSENEINAKLNELFDQKTVDGRQVYVFKDYTKHTMKMFYMERGAGASNLHMRFNLAAVKPGTVVLTKKLSGTESAYNSLIEFPYQIWYTTSADEGGQYHRLSEKTDDAYNVTYKDTVKNVSYRESMTIGGQEYADVFLLRPGESAVIDLPVDTLDYYIVECGVNTGAYDKVTANGVELTGIGDGERKDFQTTPDSMENRPQVDYDNHVRDGAMRSMSITKKLYDVNGQTVLQYPDDPTLFTFRLYLGNEFTDADNLPPANLYPYYVKDFNGNYCRWDAGSKSFVSLGITGFDALSAHLEGLTPAQRESIVFKTSMNGSINKIPAGYTIEVRDLIIGTQFKAEERDYEIPRGYELRLADGYQRTDAGHELNNQLTPISGTLHVDETPAVLVSNQKGWGLTVKKVWSDKDFMQSHDDIYFAVYLKDTSGGPGELLTNTVWRLQSSESEIYYFFDQEQMGQHRFDEYMIREVTVQPPAGAELIIDEKGKVTNAVTVIPIEDGGTLTNGGTPVGGDHRDDYVYSVTYMPGEQTTQNENVRTDTVTNARPGLKLYKTDWSWTNLPGAVFTLKDSEGRDVAAATYISGEDGLITIAYLNPGVYTLNEIRTPKGYVGLQAPMTITVSEDGSITASGPDTSLYLLAPSTETEMASVTIRNRKNELHAIKIDSTNSSLLADAHFALYWQVTDKDGNKIKDNQPIEGFADLATDEQGYLARLDLENLRAGTYYLTETVPPEGYEKLAEDLCFTIGEDGSVRINSSGHEGWLRVTADDEQGKTSFLITIPNGQLTKVSFRKVDSADTDRNLPGAEFDLYRVTDGEREQTALISGMISRLDGLLEKDGKSIFELPAGVYHLVEIKAPDGYQLRADPVVLTISGNGVSYEEGTNLSSSGSGVQFDSGTQIYTFKVSNTTGFELPSTGGVGTWPFRLGGAALLLTGLMYRFRPRRKRERGDAPL